ncbi:MAG TPA: methyltransferase domain-containing protein, partial [Dissulfurispiraceae bacterium]|nr:methyltransferase domain-containing protein [Dissulfurispiraceae bacterium]
RATHIMNNEFLYKQTIKYIESANFTRALECLKKLRKSDPCNAQYTNLEILLKPRAVQEASNVPQYNLLNLGCGQRYHSGWTNVDFKANSCEVIAHDLGKGLPFDSNSFNVVYHSHLLEHFSKEYAFTFLKNCFRVLKSGGIIRVVVPDLETIARLYLLLLEKSLKGDVEAQHRYEWVMLELFDQMVRNTSGGAMLEYWQQNPMPAEDFVVQRLGSEVKDAIAKIRTNPGATIQQSRQPDRRPDPHRIGQIRLSGEVHQWMYDRYSLSKLLQEVGFEDIRICRADESRIPDFNSYLLDIEADGSVRKPDSLFMEAKKPENDPVDTAVTVPRCFKWVGQI